MNLLNIFSVFASAGFLVPGLSLVATALIGWFYYNGVKEKKAGYVITDSVKGTYDDPSGSKVGFWDNPFFSKFIPITVLAYIVALFLVYSDYRPSKASDGVPKIQTDSTRQAAEDVLKAPNTHVLK